MDVSELWFQYFIVGPDKSPRKRDRQEVSTIAKKDILRAVSHLFDAKQTEGQQYCGEINGFLQVGGWFE